jgi:hypothetical protein
LASALSKLSSTPYDLNEEGLFDVEYADVLGIPFDFTAKPVPAPPQPPRETIQVKAMRPERDVLEIRFPALQSAISNQQATATPASSRRSPSTPKPFLSPSKRRARSRPTTASQWQNRHRRGVEGNQRGGQRSVSGSTIRRFPLPLRAAWSRPAPKACVALRNQERHRDLFWARERIVVVNPCFSAPVRELDIGL